MTNADCGNLGIRRPVMKHRFSVKFHFNEDAMQQVALLGPDKDILSKQCRRISYDSVIKEFKISLIIPEADIDNFYFCIDHMSQINLTVHTGNSETSIRNTKFIITRLISRNTEFDYADTSAAEMHITGEYE